MNLVFKCSLAITNNYEFSYLHDYGENNFLLFYLNKLMFLLSFIWVKICKCYLKLNSFKSKVVPVQYLLAKNWVTHKDCSIFFHNLGKENNKIIVTIVFAQSSKYVYLITFYDSIRRKQIYLFTIIQWLNQFAYINVVKLCVILRKIL